MARKICAFGVSHYAGSKDEGFANECVAEVCAAIIAGMPVSEDVMVVYKRLGGFDIPGELRPIGKLVAHLGPPKWPAALVVPPAAAAVPAVPLALSK